MLARKQASNGGDAVRPARLGSFRRGRGTRPDWVRSVAGVAPGPIGFDPSRVGLGSIRRRRVGGVAVWVRSVADVGFVRSGAGPRGIGCVPRRAMASLSPGAEGPRLGSIRRGAGAGRGAGRLGSIRRGPVSDLDAGSASFPSRRRAGPPGGRWGVDGGGFVDIVGSSGEKASRRRTFRSYSLRIAVGKHTFSPRWSIFPRSGILNFRRAGWSLPYVRKEAGGQASAGGAARASMASNSASTLAAKSAWIW